MMATKEGIPLSMLNPAFLNSNSTIHTWVFSAFAEIIDNAHDPDACAEELRIDKRDIGNFTCIEFFDNGAGMNRDKLHKMLSFGFCEKQAKDKHEPIGQFGSGFKSGSMRIGKDVLVFTRSGKSASVGFLSQTYLNNTNAKSVLVPILCYSLPGLELCVGQESNLKAILEHSVFRDENELKKELKGYRTGTKILIWNLKRVEGDILELDFASDVKDIRCPKAFETVLTSVYDRPVEQNKSEYMHSLREYCSILYLKPKMKIIIRGHKVKRKLISRCLANKRKFSYTPSCSRKIEITFGLNREKEKSEDYGMMLYNKNRLIRAFERVGCQKKADVNGVGVIGIAEVDFLQPVHNKQDFQVDKKYNTVMGHFGTKLNEYWYQQNMTDNSLSSSEPTGNWNWTICDNCDKERRLPDSIDPKTLPEKWYCKDNPDVTHNRCDIPQEPEDEDEAVCAGTRGRKRKWKDVNQELEDEGGAEHFGKSQRQRNQKGDKRAVRKSIIKPSNKSFNKVLRTPKQLKKGSVLASSTKNDLPRFSPTQGSESEGTNDFAVIDLTQDEDGIEPDPRSPNTNSSSGPCVKVDDDQVSTGSDGGTEPSSPHFLTASNSNMSHQRRKVANDGTDENDEETPHKERETTNVPVGEENRTRSVEGNVNFADIENAALSADVQNENEANQLHCNQCKQLQGDLNRLRGNVYRLLLLLSSEHDLGDVSDVDQLLEEMLSSHSSQPQFPSNDS